ncbi:GntR family transcriptional regulator [Paenibacillus aurantius]|uniref:GntR family transcriptional regulator n=1 Tax=Paenibacillus aurantius TaxID=2918900 RepID=A0AA96RI24_9BACL|nr:GntR family transcriptional regulator [Paenibacillus aurantius]WNQ13993.1 GntR family transcriptional regulator [Paenibacillus aurantius]
MRKPTRSVVTEEIYEIIKENILNHKLIPGEKINIDQWSRDLEVSNIPIREALSRLTAESLVAAVPFKGMFVTHMSLKELDEIFELRVPLELLALKKAFDSLDRKEIDKLLGEWRVASFPSDQSLEVALQTVAEMNDKLHGLFLNRCGNETLSQLIKQYIERIQRYLLVLHPDIQKGFLLTEHNEHLQVLEALAEGNIHQAAERLETHLRNSHLRTRKYFTESQ